MVALAEGVALLALTAGTALAAAAVDTAPPVVAITGGTLAADRVAHSLSGTASDNVAVTQVVWHNTRLARMGYATVTGSGATATWSVDRVPVAVGDNVIKVRAFDAAGNNTLIQTTITVKSGNDSVAELSPACKTFYSSTFELDATRNVDVVPALAKPAKGVAVTEPNYKTCLVRAADHKADGVPDFAINDYSRRQAFNANNTRQLIYASDGFWHLYDANTRAHLKKLAGPAGDAEPQWDPTNPDLLYFLPMSGIGMQLYEMNVATGATRVVGDFGARLKAKWPTSMAAWTRAEGSPSADGRYWCFMVDGDGWNSVGIFTWDKQTDTITGTRNTNGNRPDNVSMSPTGNYCVVSGDDTTSFSRDFSTSTLLRKGGEHSDLALDANGEDVFVTVDSKYTGEIYMTHLRTGARTVLLPGVYSAAHFSGKAYAKPGWVVLSTFDSWKGDRLWMQNKVMAVQLAANPKIYNLAFHRSAYNKYWTAPKASVNRDFTRVTFNSNWGTGSEWDVDAYTIEIPSGVLKGNTPTTPTTPTPTTPNPLTVSLAGPITRNEYRVTFSVRTDQAAECNTSHVSGQPYAWLYEGKLVSSDGLTHNATVYLDTPTDARTKYVVCKAKATGVEKELAVQIK
jgi:hypothetical protein